MLADPTSFKPLSRTGESLRIGAFPASAQELPGSPVTAGGRSPLGSIGASGGVRPATMADLRSVSPGPSGPGDLGSRTPVGGSLISSSSAIIRQSTPTRTFPELQSSMSTSGLALSAAPPRTVVREVIRSSTQAELEDRVSRLETRFGDLTTTVVTDKRFQELADTVSVIKIKTFVEPRAGDAGARQLSQFEDLLSKMKSHADADRVADRSAITELLQRVAQLEDSQRGSQGKDQRDRAQDGVLRQKVDDLELRLASMVTVVDGKLAETNRQQNAATTQKIEEAAQSIEWGIGVKMQQQIASRASETERKVQDVEEQVRSCSAEMVKAGVRADEANRAAKHADGRVDQTLGSLASLRSDLATVQESLQLQAQRIREGITASEMTTSVERRLRQLEDQVVAGPARDVVEPTGDPALAARVQELYRRLDTVTETTNKTVDQKVSQARDLLSAEVASKVQDLTALVRDRLAAAARSLDTHLAEVNDRLGTTSRDLRTHVETRLDAGWAKLDDKGKEVVERAERAAQQAVASAAQAEQTVGKALDGHEDRVKASLAAAQQEMRDHLTDRLDSHQSTIADQLGNHTEEHLRKMHEHMKAQQEEAAREMEAKLNASQEELHGKLQHAVGGLHDKLGGMQDFDDGDLKDELKRLQESMPDHFDDSTLKAELEAIVGAVRELEEQVLMGADTWRKEIDTMADDVPKLLEARLEDYHNSISQQLEGIKSNLTNDIQGGTEELAAKVKQVDARCAANEQHRDWYMKLASTVATLEEQASKSGPLFESRIEIWKREYESRFNEVRAIVDQRMAADQSQVGLEMKVRLLEDAVSANKSSAAGDLDQLQKQCSSLDKKIEVVSTLTKELANRPALTVPAATPEPWNPPKAGKKYKGKLEESSPEETVTVLQVTEDSVFCERLDGSKYRVSGRQFVRSYREVAEVAEDSSWWK